MNRKEGKNEKASRRPELRPQPVLIGAAGVLLLLLLVVILQTAGRHKGTDAPADGSRAAVREAEADGASALREAQAAGAAPVQEAQADGAAPAAQEAAGGEIPLLAADQPGGGAAAGAQAAAEAAPAPTQAPKWASPMERYYKDDTFWNGCPPRDVQLLTPNEYSRPETGLDEVNDIVIHYVDEPGSTAQQNRDYFESLKDGSGRSVSSHFIISLDGTIVQCIPLGEVAYASNHRNSDTISIECCHPDSSGEFTDETYASCVDLTAWLCYVFELSPDHVIRHYDVSGKDCPIFYVRNPEAWEQLKRDVADRYEAYVADYGPRSKDA